MPTENRSSNTEQMVACDDGLHLIQLDENSSHFGWVFRKIQGGLPYSVRKATEHEMAHAKARQHLRAGVAQIAAQPAAQHQVEPTAWLDPNSGRKANTIGHAVKMHNEKVGGAPATVAALYTVPLYRQSKDAPIPSQGDEQPVACEPDFKTDENATYIFSKLMVHKLAKKSAEGRSGWQECSQEDLTRMLREHVEKGDPVDVANFCMMLCANGMSIGPADAGEVEHLREAYARAGEREHALRKTIAGMNETHAKLAEDFRVLRADLASTNADKAALFRTQDLRKLLERCLMAVREQHCDPDEAEFDLPTSLMAEIDAALSAGAEPEVKP